MGEQKRRKNLAVENVSTDISLRTKLRVKTAGGGVTREWIVPALATVFLLTLIALGGADVIQTAIPWLLALAGVAVFIQFLRGKTGPITGISGLAVLLYMAAFGISTFFAASGKFAMKEYSKILLAFFGYLLLTLFLSGDETKKAARTRGLLFGIAAATAVIGLASIDSTLGGLFTQLISPITKSFLGQGGVELNTRITSILGNPNVFAGVIGIGIFSSLALTGGSETPTWRRAGVLLLELNAMSFLLAFSMGACLAIACGFGLFLLFGDKGTRGVMLLLMGEVLVVTFTFSFVIFSSLDGSGILPLVLTVVTCAVVLALDQFVSPRILSLLGGKGKIVTVAVCVLVVVVAVFLALALMLTRAAELAPGEIMRRSAYPEPGQYTLSAEGIGDVVVTIESQDLRETVIHDSTVLYTGSARGAEFTVPDGSLVVYFNFSSPTGANLEKAVWSGTQGQGTLPLDYPLLPSFISNRLQGFFANQNAIQRFAFFSDGLKLFAKSPVVGNGVGGFENGVMSVQDFYYETGYIHNHYIQSLCDAGILGLASFLFLLVTMALTLIRNRRVNRASNWLVPALFGCIVFMAVHAGVEVIFSHATYLVFAFAAFALMGAQRIETEGGKKQPIWAARMLCAGVCALCAIFCVLWSLSVYAQHAATSTNSREAFLATAERVAPIDLYNRNDYMLTYVLSVESSDSEAILTKAEQYAKKLASVRSNSIGQYLVGYYLKQGRPTEAFEIAVKSVEYTKSSAAAWNEMFYTLAVNTQSDSYKANLGVYQTGISALYERFQQVSIEQLDHPQLNEGSIAYIESVLG